MKKFIRLTLLFLAPLIMISICCELLLRHIPNDYIIKRRYLDKNSNNIEVLVLGSSHGYFAINPAYISSKAYNAAYLNQPIELDWDILKRYDTQWHNLKYIILPVDVNTLYLQLGKFQEQWRLKNYNIYYGINAGKSITDYMELFSNTVKTNKYRLQSYYQKHVSPVTTSGLGWGTNYNSKIHTDLDSTGLLAAKRHSVVIDGYFEKNIVFLRSILEYAKTRKIGVILFTSPAYKSYINNLNAAQLANTIRTAASLAKEYDNTRYYNFVNDTTFKTNDFYDGDHLNEIGAQKFTKIINQHLINDFK